MKRVKAMNGYTIYESTARDVKRGDAVDVGEFYLYFSRDIREYGREFSDAEWGPCGTLKEAEEWASGETTIYTPVALEAVANVSTCIDFADVEKLVNAMENGAEIDPEDVDNVMELLDAPETPEAPEKQTFTSAATSINGAKLPAVYGYIERHYGAGFWRRVSVIDIGGGKFDNARDHVREYGGNLAIYDPYNRTPEENADALSGLYDAAIISNVLNVIDSAAARLDVLKTAADRAPVVFITVYEGDRSGVGRRTGADSWQENRKLADYLPEIRRVFPVVDRVGNMLICRA